IANHMVDGDLKHDEACMILQSLVIAGHETTANMIALGTLLLLREPERFTRLRDHASPELIATTVEEMLRYWSVVHFTGMRVATEDVEFGGVTIKAGEGILPQMIGANYDA